MEKEEIALVSSIIEELIKERKIDFSDSDLNYYEITSFQIDILGRLSFKGFMEE